MYTEYSGIYVLVGIVFIIILTGLVVNRKDIIESYSGFEMKDSTKQYITFAVAASTCVFLLYYTIPLLFKLVNWTFTQPLYVRAGVVPIIVGSAVFAICVALGRINNE